jgi:hypothetical protein
MNDQSFVKLLSFQSGTTLSACYITLSALYVQISRRSILTPQTNTMKYHLQVLRLAQLRCKSAAALLDIFSKREINVSIPLIVEANTTQYDTIVRTTWKDIRGVFVDSLRRAKVHSRHGSFGAFDEHDLTLLSDQISRVWVKL